jgi:hypothetical protein
MAAAIPVLKVGLGAAIITGASSKSCWHLARTPATQMGVERMAQSTRID